MIAVLYYLHDVPKHKRIQTKLNLCAHEMVNILQNTSQSRDSAHKKITADDIRRAMAEAYLSIFPGKTMYIIARHTTPLGYGPFTVLFCVKGLGGGKARVLWQYAVYTVDFSYSPLQITVVDGYWSGRTLVTTSTNTDMAAIYPDLKIQNGEIKIIVECMILTEHKEAFGFFVLSPRNRNCCYFNTVVIFTPKPGLFDETAPI